MSIGECPCPVGLAKNDLILRTELSSSPFETKYLLTFSTWIFSSISFFCANCMRAYKLSNRNCSALLIVTQKLEFCKAPEAISYGYSPRLTRVNPRLSPVSIDASIPSLLMVRTVIGRGWSNGVHSTSCSFAHA